MKTRNDGILSAVVVTPAAERKADPAHRVADAIEWVIGDRQRHERRIQSLPSGDRATLEHTSTPSLRIYVATREGTHHLIDDRSSLRDEAAARVDILEADYTSSSNPLQPIISGGLERIACPSECKGEMLYLLAQDNKRRPRCEYVAFIDDDIEVSVSDLLAGAEQAKKRKCSVFQIQLSQDSYAVWPQLKQQPEQSDAVPTAMAETWSDVRFVEIMAPVIAQSELDLGLLDLLAPLKSGFGWDFYLLTCLNELYDDFRLGLYRGAVMRHKRPINTGNNSHFSNGLTALQEEELIRAALILSLVELREVALEDRSSLLQHVGHTLHSLRPDQGSGLLSGIASGLHSTTQRYWLSRELEQQCRDLGQRCHDLGQQYRDLLEDRDRLTNELKQQNKQHQDLMQQQLENLKRIKQELDEAQTRVLERDQRIRAIIQSMTWRIGKLILTPIRLMRALAKLPGTTR